MRKCLSVLHEHTSRGCLPAPNAALAQLYYPASLC